MFKLPFESSIPEPAADPFVHIRFDAEPIKQIFSCSQTDHDALNILLFFLSNVNQLSSAFSSLILLLHSHSSFQIKKCILKLIRISLRFDSSLLLKTIDKNELISLLETPMREEILHTLFVMMKIDSSLVTQLDEWVQCLLFTNEKYGKKILNFISKERPSWVRKELSDEVMLNLFIKSINDQTKIDCFSILLNISILDGELIFLEESVIEMFFHELVSNGSASKMILEALFLVSETEPEWFLEEGSAFVKVFESVYEGGNAGIKDEIVCIASRLSEEFPFIDFDFSFILKEK